MEWKDQARPMSNVPDDSPPTRQSLLSRLRDLDDCESWRTFFDLYWRLIYNLARRAGLDDSSAQDIVQETVIAVARKMPGFQYDPQRGSFKRWLLTITGRRISDHLRKTYRNPGRADMPLEQLEADDTCAEAEIDPGTRDLAAVWEEEWQRAMFDAAVARVRRESNPKHFQVFDYCVLKGWPVSRVAATLDLNAAQVYMAKHRLSRAIRRAVQELSRETREGGH
jgi:RNA polymerase sigma factor (sigma-70 family)